LRVKKEIKYNKYSKDDNSNELKYWINLNIILIINNITDMNNN
jgi:hypothetical protein